MTAPVYAIVAAEYNRPLVDAMVETATAAFTRHGLPLGRVLRVPGAYELPLVAAVELGRPEVGGLVVLGYIERGETLHGEVMGHVVQHALMDIQLRERKPIGMGIVGPGATAEQAQVRHIKSAEAAVNAVKRVVDLIRA